MNYMTQKELTIFLAGGSEFSASKSSSSSSKVESDTELVSSVMAEVISSSYALYCVEIMFNVC